MKTCVMLRQAPDPESNVAATGDGDICWGHLPPVANASDLSALELALRLRENGCIAEVVVVAAGDASVDKLLHLGVAMGADRATRIQVKDCHETSPARLGAMLVEPLQHLEVTLLLCGQDGAGDDNAVAAHVAAAELGWSIVTGVVNVMIEGSVVQVVRKLEKGWRENLETDVPSVIAVHASIAQARYVGRSSLARASKQVAIDIWDRPDRSIDCDVTGDREAVRYVRPLPSPLFVPDPTLPALERLELIASGGILPSKAARLKGSPQEVAVQLADFFEHRFGDPASI